MNKKNLLLAFAAGIALLSGCNEAKNEWHTIYFYPQSANLKVFYADQTSDTLHLLSTDAWRIASTASWLTVSPESNAPQGQQSYVDTKLTLSMQANTTGAYRDAVINAYSHDNVSMPVRQLPWLNVRRPDPVYLDANNQVVGIASAQKVRFALSMQAAASTDSVMCYTYAPGALLKAQTSDWLYSPDTTFSTTGLHKVYVHFSPNATAEPRSATLTLTSAGTSTPIILTQEGKKPE